MSCPDCNKGYILEGTPSGTITKVNGVDAYFVSGAPPDPSKSIAIVLTDAFGLALVNSKIIADKISKELACDVWVPDLFNGCIICAKFSLCSQYLFPDFPGQPFLDPDGMEAQLLPDRPGPWPVWDQIRLYIRIIGSLPTIFRSRPSVVDPRAAEVRLGFCYYSVSLIRLQFIKTIREKNKYGKIGGVGYVGEFVSMDVWWCSCVTGVRYCFGGGVAARLVPFKVMNSMVLCHPSMLSDALIRAIDVRTSLR
jgi:carboxymethylenebutenolidase